MKIAGVVLTVLGVALLLVAVKLAPTKYDFHNTDEIGQSLGGFAFAAVVLAGGITLMNKARESE